MADKIQIPKFREKVVNWKDTDGKEYSFTVTASYRGILRLSPNDDGSLREKDLFSAPDEGGVNLYYQDSIDDIITKQFIGISTSDGYFVNLRLSLTDIESDNIYVIGVAHHDLLRLFAKQDNAFKLNGHTAMPARANLATDALIGSEGKINTDVTSIDTSSPTERSYVLVSHNKKERLFEYEQATNLIRSLVKEVLLDLQVLPTGSIHFTPINIHEYAKMLMQGIPNSYFLKDGETPNDPIVRDFLVCDGSLYYNKDYPELAKILEGERIDYWRYDQTKDRMVQATYINDYSKNKWFRVPDLRSRFIKAVYADKAHAGAENNTTGSYTNDSLPSKNDFVSETHTHFITTAFYQNTPEMQNYSKVASMDVETGEVRELSDKPGVLHPHNENQLQGCIWLGPNDDPIGGAWTSDQQIHFAFMGSSYFLSVPQDYSVTKKTPGPTIGVTSYEIPACVIDPTSDDQLDYNGRTDYVPFVGSGAASSYAMEIAPENYAALPLIKI